MVSIIDLFNKKNIFFILINKLRWEFFLFVFMTEGSRTKLLNPNENVSVFTVTEQALMKCHCFVFMNHNLKTAFSPL